ncbi:glycerol-3-phosphate cytidylyltransferase [Paenochrobactrum pullorum]|uniref:glycerol-3-phosphate cytidylyltransferase n=1 Tax=Paenochrobactrum pullorum TaxID=1324351 RepID=UPI0035BBF263
MKVPNSAGVILTYGTFDIFHAGHVNILRRARELGSKLIVAVSTDEFNALKGKKSLFSYEERKLIVESSKYVDLVIPEENWEQKIEDVKRYNVSTFVMGHDWAGKFDFLKPHCDVIYLDRTPIISSTYYKNAIHAPAA